MLCQDITITLNLTDISIEEYQRRLKLLNELNDNGGEVTTYTYDPERSDGQYDKLTPEQLDYVESLQ